MTSDEKSQSGPDRIREAIARDRGDFAPGHPVTLCGRPDGTEVRADSQPIQEIHVSLGERVAGLVQCPSCLGLRFGPVHLLKRLLVGKH